MFTGSTDASSAFVTLRTVSGAARKPLRRSSAFRWCHDCWFAAVPPSAQPSSRACRSKVMICNVLSRGVSGYVGYRRKVAPSGLVQAMLLSLQLLTGLPLPSADLVSQLLPLLVGVFEPLPRRVGLAAAADRLPRSELLRCRSTCPTMSRKEVDSTSVASARRCLSASVRVPANRWPSQWRIGSVDASPCDSEPLAMLLASVR